ncbi:MAG: hypothetical protein SCM11_14815 [Bacillota bacterium]|nr:hypothetical protein [Bacillota bacterium]
MLILRDIDGPSIGRIGTAQMLLVTDVNLTASQWPMELSALALITEILVNHGETGQTDRNTFLADGEVGVLLLVILGIVLKRNDRIDVPIL